MKFERWLWFAEFTRTKIIADPSVFEVDEEFFRINPQTSKEAFEKFLNLDCVYTNWIIFPRLGIYVSHPAIALCNSLSQIIL